MKYKIFIDILLLIGVVYLFSMCSNGNRTVYNDNRTHKNDVSHYIDTIRGHIILTTVCYNYNTGDVSVSTLKLNNN